MPSNRGSFKAWLFLYNGWLWGICLYTFFFTSFLLNKVNTSIAVSQENIRIKKNSSNVQYLDFFFFCLSQFVHYASENFCPTSCSVQCAIQWVSDLNDLTTCRTCLCITIDLINFFFLSQFLIFNREPRRMTWEITVYWTTWSWVFVLQGKKYNWLFLHVQQPDENQVFLR